MHNVWDLYEYLVNINVYFVPILFMNIGIFLTFRGLRLFYNTDENNSLLGPFFLVGGTYSFGGGFAMFLICLFPEGFVGF